MAYVPTYQISFTNELMNEVVITLSELDGAAVAITSYVVSSAKLSYTGDEGKFAPIHGMSFECEFFVDVDETDPTPVLVQAEKDTWKVEVTIDAKPFFSGFLVPDEGGTPFQDLPYNVKITATDGLGMLKETTIEEGTFNSHHSIISYIAYCLQQTGLDLPIRVADNVYHTDFLNRDDSTEHDFFSQAYLEYRTFQKDATTFLNCYEALELIFKNNYRISQDNGEWKISRVGMLQYDPFVHYETLYDANGENPVGVEVTENYATVGRNELIYPHGEDQIKYIKRAVKSSKAKYNYEIWPELPTNNKFERGSFVEEETAYDESDMDGDGDFAEEIGIVRKYAINNWSWGGFDLNDHPNHILNTGQTEQPLVHKIFNEGVEVLREISLPPSDLAGDGFLSSGLQCTAIPVVQGSRIKVSVDKRYTGASNESGTAAMVWLRAENGVDFFYLQKSTDPTREGSWSFNEQNITSELNSLLGVNVTDTDTRRYSSVSVESQPIPCNGNLYIILVNNTEETNFFKNVTLEYEVYVAGGFQKIKGDYDKLTQTANYPDNGEYEVMLSDTPHKVFKGCLLNSAGIPLTPQFYRMGISEEKSYKAICNYQHFNLEHRRMDMIEGSFTSLMYAPANNQEYYYPISLHKQYRFVDIAGDDTRFLLSSPLEMDLVRGWLTARFWEIYDDAHIFMDGRTNGTEEYKFIF